MECHAARSHTFRSNGIRILHERPPALPAAAVDRDRSKRDDACRDVLRSSGCALPGLDRVLCGMGGAYALRPQS